MQTIAKNTWTAMQGMQTKFIRLTLFSDAGSDAATFDVFGSRDGGITAAPMARVDTMAEALAITLTTAAAKPTGTTLYSASVRLAREGAEHICIRETSAAGGTYSYGIEETL